MNHLKKLREERSWKQSYIAEKLSVGVAAVSKYESGKVLLRSDTIILLANLYNVSTDYLLGVSPVRGPYKNVKKNPIQLSKDEYDLMYLYKSLDSHGKEVVRELIVEISKGNYPND